MAWKVVWAVDFSEEGALSVGGGGMLADCREERELTVEFDDKC